MRKFKFRAWDTKLKEMVFHDTHVFSQPRYKPMQWTGCKDKKKKDIFESDIVAYVPNEFGKLFVDNPLIGVIEWVEDNATFRVTGHFRTTGAGMAMESVDVYGLPNLGYMEVIGNIHENPELLEPKESEEDPDVEISFSLSPSPSASPSSEDEE